MFTAYRRAGGRGSEHVGGASVSVHQHHQRDHARRFQHPR